MAPKTPIDYRLAAMFISRVLKNDECRDEDRDSLEAFVYEAKAMDIEQAEKQARIPANV